MFVTLQIPLLSLSKWLIPVALVIPSTSSSKWLISFILDIPSTFSSKWLIPVTLDIPSTSSSKWAIHVTLDIPSSLSTRLLKCKCLLSVSLQESVLLSQWRCPVFLEKEHVLESVVGPRRMAVLTTLDSYFL